MTACLQYVSLFVFLSLCLRVKANLVSLFLHQLAIRLLQPLLLDAIECYRSV